VIREKSEVLPVPLENSVGNTTRHRKGFTELCTSSDNTACLSGFTYSAGHSGNIPRFLTAYNRTLQQSWGNSDEWKVEATTLMFSGLPTWSFPLHCRSSRGSLSSRPPPLRLYSPCSRQAFLLGTPTQRVYLRVVTGRRGTGSRRPPGPATERNCRCTRERSPPTAAQGRRVFLE
jgi:hypothetical protein